MGYISIDRKIMEWEWYKNQNVKNLFFHCLLKANYTDKPWQGQIIHRGQFVTSLDNLATQTGLSVSKVRTALKKLNMTKELTSEGTPRNTVITVNNYDKYQDNNKQIDKQIANKSQTNDKQIATTNKDNKDNKDNNSLSHNNKPTREEREKLKNYAKRMGTKNPLAYTKTLINNGDYVEVLKEIGKQEEKENIVYAN